MKGKKLWISLFLLYWFIVYGLSFLNKDELNSKVSEVIPTRYRMFAPVTKTNFDIEYVFYYKGKEQKKLMFSEYLREEYEKSILYNKRSFIKEKIYQGNVKILDFHYQETLYQEKYQNKPNDFEQRLNEIPVLNYTLQSLGNFPLLYLKENPEIKSDSVQFSVYRAPMVLPFKTEYDNDFTYEIGPKYFLTQFLLLKS